MNQGRCRRRGRSQPGPAARVVLAALCALAVRCAEEEVSSGPPLGTVIAPFPSDIFTVQDKSSTSGVKLDLQVSQINTPLIEPGLDLGMWKREKLLAWLNRLDGFSTFGPIFFLTSQAPDPSSLPTDGPASTAQGASLFLVSLQQGSATYGQRVPILASATRVNDAKLGIIHVMSIEPQTPLKPASLHAVVALKTLRTTGGEALAESDFYGVLRGRLQMEAHSPLAARMERGREQAGPLWDFLGTAGIAKDQVAEAFVFTTQGSTSLINAVRKVMHGPSAPPLNLKWKAAYAPDQLPNRPSDAGDLSAIASVVTGELDALDFRQADGSVAEPPVAAKVLRVPFIIALPASPAKPPFKVVMLQHGHGGRKEYALYVAPYLAQQGIATAAIDHIAHGELKGKESFFQLLDLGKMRGNFVQTIANGLRFVQLLRSIGSASVGGTSFSLSTAGGVGYIGESLGGICGTSLSAVEPDVGVVVLNVAGGGLSTSLMGGYLDLLGEDELLLKLGLISVFQMLMDRVDPVSFAPLFYLEPAAGKGKPVLMQNVVSDSLGLRTVEVLAGALGASYVCPCPAQAPLSSLPRTKAPATAPGLFYYATGKHGFLLSEPTYPAASKAVRRQATYFFQTFFQGGKALIIDPLSH